ncbi:acyl-CoA dehydrogenase family protein [Piscinibacter sp. HJYY11]|uniref:acyl-CoA dehydrogenase family protein n=1 Tax=Piscinibacter sp. HJYY11 TaxID=2801333 RepID=UPI00191FFA91|nr:acyl-CoA dehydrogenase family protein [Piscinibacter sp. HJYY11]MBL0729976.1 acyl-CoA/acyl-ACP dehydrogenase [Piscinibacter sp. HJYY11]
MALVLTEEQGMLRDSAKSFLADNAPVSELRKLRDTRNADGFSRSLWKQFAEMGFTGVLIPEAYGGMGLGLVEAGVVMEEIGRNLTASPFLASNVVAATALLAAGTEAQKQAILPKIASGELIATLAVDEHSKHNPRNTALKAEKSASGYTLDGHKTFVLDGHVADLFIVAARTSGAKGELAGVTLFLVDAKTKGVSVERVVMVDAHNAARVTLNNIPVPESAVLGKVGEGLLPLNAALSAGRVAASAEMLGIADEVFARTVNYLKERQQFTKIIGEFQALQHRAAHLYCEIEFTRSAVLKALQALDEGTPTAIGLASVAKAKAGTTVTLAVQEGVQMHGGIGMTDEFEMGFFMKRARVLQELFGDATYHADLLAQLKKY